MGKRKRRKRRPPVPDESSSAPESSPASRPAVPDRLNRPFAKALQGVEARPRDEVGASDRAETGSASASSMRVDPSRRASSPPRGGHDLPPATRGPAHPTGGGPSNAGGDDYEDRVAFQRAFADVQPLAPKRANPAPRSPARADEPPTPRHGAGARDTAGDEAARSRLAALVAGGLTFRIHREPDGTLEALRSDAHPSALRTLVRGHPVPEATLDLHGERFDAVARRVDGFVRARHRCGDRVLCVVHGKGRHSEGGVGVLDDRVVHALTEGGAAPLVLAFATAPARLGGRGALLVQLAR